MRILLVGLCFCTSTVFAQTGTGLVDRTGTTVIAIDSGAGHDLWSVSHRTWDTAVVASGLSFQDLNLVGYPIHDELRRDRPRPGRVSEVPDHVLLPGGGALYRAVRGTKDELLHVRDGEVRVLLSVAGTLQPWIHVSMDGQRAAVSTTTTSGGDVWQVDVEGGTAQLLTGGLAALNVAGDSLRAGASSSWFVADGMLYRGSGADAVPVDLGATTGESVDPQLLLSEESAHVLVVLDEAPTLRRLALVDDAGSVTLLTPLPGARSLAGLTDALGPFLAIAADGSAVAWREEGATHEIFVLAPGAAPVHLTIEPDFPEYIDNVGVMGFLKPDTLVYLAGDVTLSPETEEGVIGAADMYVAELIADGSLLSSNLTRTSGQTWPPFTEVGQLLVEHLLIDPDGERAVIVGPAQEEDDQLACFKLGYALYGHGPNLQVLLPGLDSVESFFGATRHVMSVSEPTVDSGPLVHVLQPFLPGVQVFTQVVDFPDEVDIDQVTAAGRFAAFVASGDEDWESVPWIVDLVTPQAFPLVSTGAELSPTLDLTTRGEVIVGYSVNDQEQVFVRIGAPNALVPLDVPSGDGFPLPN